jgi:radical SAM-linked protein
MQSESQEAAPGAPATPDASSTRAKYRIRFRKAGELRLVSHHDLMHCFERMFRRAALPVARSRGFNPRPRLWFAQSLALGVVGLNEVLELELTEAIAPEDVERRLGDQCPPGLAILTVKSIDIRAAAHVRRARFRLPLAAPILDLSQRCGEFLSAEHHWIERTRPNRRRIDLRPFVAALEPGDSELGMTLWITPHGAARPEEVVEALGLHALIEAGAVLERVELELADEITDDVPMPAGLPARPSTEELPKEESDERTASGPSAVRPTAIITGPLSFDS